MSTPDLRATHPLPGHGGELVLVRHGQSVANAQGIGQGRAEYPLSELGRRQAILTAAHLARLGGFTALYTSPLSRAAETAAALGEALGLTPIPVPALVEIDIGALSGRQWDELATLHPAEMAAYRAAEKQRPHPRNRELIPGWEPVAEVLARTWTAIADIASAHPGERVAVVAHGGVLNGYLTHLLTGDAHEVPWRYHAANCAISRIVLEPTGPKALCVVDDRHLAQEASGLAVFDPPRGSAPP